MKKGILFLFWTVFIILIAIQFVPTKHENPASDANLDFLVQNQAPIEIQEIVRNACYDCHSNTTAHPWYSYVAPISFVIAEHVEEGRGNLNFSEWGHYNPEDYSAILKQIKKEIQQEAMPLPSYVWMHKEAKMTSERKILIINWLDQIIAQSSATKEN